MSAAATFDRSWRKPAASPSAVAVLFVALQLAAGWLAGHLLGGAGAVRPVWFYFPVLYGGVRFGVLGAAATAAAATLVAGPLLPLDVASATAQPPWLWGSRGLLFVVLGVGVTAVLDRTMAPVRSERATGHLRHALTQALRRDELVVHYQPIVSLPDRVVVGFEALLRWQHPDRGLVPPDEFIPAAEASGLIVPMGARTLEEACRQGAEWHRRFSGTGPPLTVSVNVSARQLGTPAVVDQVLASGERTGFDLAFLHLEVTESALVDDLDVSRDRLAAIRETGARVAVDDFGTGYASLTYLRALPFDVVKIDRSFVSGLEEGAEDRAIVEGIISLAHALGKEVVAEGVETAAQLEVVAALGCDFAQGWHLGRPEPADVVTRLLEGARV